MSTILIVDDRASNRQFLTTLLRRGGHRLLEAANGAAALDLVRAEHPDLVITDMLMPNMNGYEFVQHLRSDPELARTPVIFQTASYRAQQAQALARSCGVDVVLPKPCGLQVILAAVSRALGTEAPAAASAAGNHAAAQATELLQPDDPGRRYIRDLQAVKLDFDEVIEHSAKLIAQRDLAREVSAQLATNVAGLQHVMSRLSALIEVGMEMEAERDPAKLVEVMFAAACDIIDSEFAAVGMLDEQEQALRHVYAKGIDPGILQAPDDPRGGMLGLLLSGHGTVRARGIGWAAGAEGLPAGHPPVASILALAIRSADRVYGWIYFANKTGAPEFSVEDERLANIMATKLALLYENLCLFDVVQRHAAKLQIEASERRRAEGELRESERRFNDMLGNVRLVSLMLDREARITYCNDYLLRLTGWRRDEVMGRNWFELFVAPGHDDLRDAYADLIAGVAGASHYENEILTRAGGSRLIRWNYTMLRSAAGAVTGTASIGEDITERKEAEDRIRALNRVYAVLSGINALIFRVRDREALLEGMCRIAVEAGRFRLAWIGLVDREAMKILPAASAGAKPEDAAFHADRLASSMEPLAGDGLAARAIRQKTASVSNDVRDDPGVGLRQELSDRGIRSLALLPLLVADEAVGVLALYAEEAGFFDEQELNLLTGLAGDISGALDHIGKSEKLKYLAFYDPLTGLPNRALFRERLSHSLHARSGEAPLIAVALLDVERFRRVNETLGRAAGEELLRCAAARLKGASDSAARVGIDIFAFTLRGAHSVVEVNRAVEAIAVACFAEPFLLDGVELNVAYRVGIALHPADGTDADALLHNAEAALRRSNRSGERILFYAPEMNARLAETLAIENRLRRALERQEFVLHYQPKVRLPGGCIAGVEALIRWQDPQQGLVLPGRFIPLLEETGIIVEVGLWVIERALADLAGWAAKGLVFGRVAVNVSAIQLQREDFVGRVNHAVRHSGDAAGLLELEITESLLMHDVEASIRKLSILRATGIRISMDDFGTGYSSLSYLARLPIDAVKIDRSFVSGMVANAEDATIVGGIVALVHSLGNRVIAEGVETFEQAQRLAALGCDEAQGFHYSRAVPAAQIEALMLAGGTLPAP